MFIKEKDRMQLWILFKCVKKRSKVANKGEKMAATGSRNSVPYPSVQMRSDC